MVGDLRDSTLRQQLSVVSPILLFSRYLSVPQVESLSPESPTPNYLIPALGILAYNCRRRLVTLYRGTKTTAYAEALRDADEVEVGGGVYYFS